MSRKYFVYVDDESLLGSVFEDLYFPFEDLSYQFFTNPEIALDFIKSNDIAGILCDYQMPQMDGLEFSKYVPESIPFLLVSGNLEIDVLKYKNIKGILHKPFDDNDIYEFLNEITSDSSS